MKSHLGDEGRFVFDVFNPQVSFLAADPSARYERARYPDPHGGGEVVLEETRVHCRAANRALHPLLSCRREKRRLGEQLGAALLLSCELDLILEHFGFRLAAKYGDFDDSPLQSRSPKQICICSSAG